MNMLSCVLYVSSFKKLYIKDKAILATYKNKPGFAKLNSKSASDILHKECQSLIFKLSNTLASTTNLNDCIVAVKTVLGALELRQLMISVLPEDE